MKYRVLLGTGKWAKYVDKDIESQASFTKKAIKCLPNKLTPLYFKIYYKEKNYLKVKTELFIYLSPPHSKGSGMWECWYVGTLHSYILAYSRTSSCDSATPRPIVLLVPSVPRPAH